MFFAVIDPTRELAPSTTHRKYHAGLYFLLLTEIIFEKHVFLEMSSQYCK